MSLARDIRKRIDHTPFVDTHEHLLEESVRVHALNAGEESKLPAPDWGWLFTQYCQSDLHVAGMSREQMKAVLAWNTNPRDKWKILEPWYRRTRHTGYLLAARESLRLLFGVDDLNAQNVDEVAAKFQAGISNGYYNVVLRDFANVEYTQVNAIEPETVCFRETALPDLLAQDLSFVALATQPDVARVAERAGRSVQNLADWHGVIDWYFATFGPRAIAVKNQSAYARRLDYAQVSADEAAPLFARFVTDPRSLGEGEHKAIQDHLFHYCVRKATEYKLPVKLHLGYYAGENSMPLHRVKNNAADISEILRAHPEARFILMHVAYPYQDEVIALAKHYANAYVDLCWAWIINPAASVRFVKEFLMAAPACKLLTFGGDYMAVESVPGHASLARRGLAQALVELTEESWLNESDLEDLIERLMRGNAHELFDLQATLRHWSIPAKPSR